ncbi:MAG TPA: hypothetical protein VH597_15210 [Verrucomicrobiae bacterium]|jgi:hypothetical protein|nr:hypothetical protein [Verrucomicrobiae bacterium]
MDPADERASQSEEANSGQHPGLTRLERYVPLAAWAAVILVLLFIALKITAYGYLPGGDLRRHVAKAFTDKPYPDIVVMRPGYTVDNSPGWDWLLTALHRNAGWGKDALVGFSIVGLMLCFFYAPLPWLRRPEAWLLALLTAFLTRPSLLGNRLSQGRPLVLTEAVLIALLFAWARPNSNRPSWLKIVLTCIGFSLSVWIHGAWYLWVVPLAAFFLAGAWRSGLWLTACYAAGTLIGGVLSGHPLRLLGTALTNVFSIFHESPPQWMLVGELAPDRGDIAVVAALALIFLGSRLLVRKKTSTVSGVWLRPVVALMILCWVLGFKVDRFWADWGIPAALVWMTLHFQEFLEEFQTVAVGKRLATVALIAAPLYLAATNDTDRRYTANFTQPFLSAEDPALQGWFPGHNGIFYSVQMDLFYDTFYTNPSGDWRYILGFEPALMPDNDLKIMRQIVGSQEAVEAYQLWINKMRPEDRLAIFSSTRPNLPQLEWLDATQYIWIGRLPHTESK